MRTLSIFFVSSSLLIPAWTAVARNRSDVSPITVEYIHPENFRDFAPSQTGGEKERQGLEDEFRRRIQDVAPRYLPEGYRVVLRFEDIDMAGEYEPQLGPKFNNVRIMRGIYPPSIKAAYTVFDPKGEIVASGQKRETDLSFQNIISIRKDRPLFYETELVIDLLRDITRSL